MELSNFQELIVERQHLLERIKELEEENVELRKRLGEHVMHVAQEPKAMQKLSLLEKVNLFRSLFKGREDVFARRWFSKATGKAGYQPVCQNEWGQLCDKRKFSTENWIIIKITRLFVKFLQKYEFSFEIPRENSNFCNYFMIF